MSRSHAAELPSVAEALRPLLRRIATDRQPLLIAYAERLAAQRYRDWARHPELVADAARLRACAAREEDIATRIEGLFTNAAALQQALVVDNPDLDNINRDLFAGRPLAEQMAIQANGERLGAATWRAFARHENDASRRDVFVTCAGLEEASAEVLEAILAAAE